MWVILSRHSGLPQIYNTNERNEIDHVSLFKKKSSLTFNNLQHAIRSFLFVILRKNIPIWHFKYGNIIDHQILCLT